MNINKAGAYFDNVKAHHKTSHGLSLLALCMLEQGHDGLVIETKLDNENLISEAFDQVSAIILRKVRLRSYIDSEGKFADNYRGFKTMKKTGVPDSHEFTNMNDVMCDVNMQSPVTIMVYRYAEKEGRKLIMN